MRVLQEAFGLHPLSVEDCLDERQDSPQKNETFEHYRLISFSEVHYAPGKLQEGFGLNS